MSRKQKSPPARERPSSSPTPMSLWPTLMPPPSTFLAHSFWSRLERALTAHPVHLWHSPSDLTATTAAGPESESASSSPSIPWALMAVHSLECGCAALATETTPCAFFTRLTEFGWPDFVVIRPEMTTKNPTLKLEDLEPLLARFGHQPIEGKNSIVLIEPAESITSAAQNKLLKLLEEPTPSLRVLLVTSNPELLLPTFLSRTLRLRLPNLETASPVQKALPWLSRLESPDYSKQDLLLALEHCGQKPELITEAANALERGYLARARELSSLNSIDPSFDEMLESIFKFNRLNNGPFNRKVLFSNHLAKWLSANEECTDDLRHPH